MKVLVTGATGFVGRPLVASLRDAGYEVHVLVRSPAGIKGVTEHHGDLGKKESLNEATKGIEVILHLAGVMLGDLMGINAEGTRNLVEAAVRNRVKRFIFVSTFDVLMRVPYGESKREAEKMVRESGMEYLIFRPTVVYGEGMKKDIGRLVQLIRRFPVVPVPGDGRAKFQPVLVDDFVELLIRSMTAKSINKEYWVGGAQEVSYNRIVDIIAGLLGRKPYRVTIPKALIVGRRSILLKDKVCDIKPLERDFGFSPVSFEEGMRKVLSR